jgi:hypothetical protein
MMISRAAAIVDSGNRWMAPAGPEVKYWEPGWEPASTG